MNQWEVREGDVLTRLAEMPDESVQCVVTSPPYWGLRDYGVAGQIGLEPTLEEYVAKMTAVFQEVRRVLRKDGTLWCNMGDAYASAWPCSRRNVIGSRSLPDGKREARPPRLPFGLKDKDLIGMPWRVAFALQADGWWLRSDIVWSKPNPMPESVRDRPARAHEYLFLLVKAKRYFYDSEAVSEAVSGATMTRLSQPTFDMQTGGPKDPGTGNRSCRKALENLRDRARAGDHSRVPSGWEGGTRPATPGSKRRAYPVRNADGATPRHSTDQRKCPRWSTEELEATRRNRRTVWTISTQPFPDAHFATFPEKLVEPCILAGTKQGDIVLDPFAGSGTTGVVARKLDRRFVGIELNPEYCEMARKRIGEVAPLLDAAAVGAPGI